MKNVIITLITVVFLYSFASVNSISNSRVYQKVQDTKNIELGKKLFIQNGCTICHHERKEGLAPMLKVICETYKDDKEKLVKFLKRESEPIVEPKDFGIMAANLFKTKKMKDEEREALADYILSIK